MWVTFVKLKYDFESFKYFNKIIHILLYGFLWYYLANCSNTTEFCLKDDEVLQITELISSVEKIYEKPVDIEWAFANNTLYLLQARPITAYVPIPKEMMVFLLNWKHIKQITNYT